MKATVTIQKNDGKKKEFTAEDGLIIPVESGDDVEVLDENGEPADVKLVPNGDDLDIVFPNGEVVTLDEFYKYAGGAGEPITVALKEIDQEIAENGNYEFNQGTLGRLPSDSDFTLMRYSYTNYTGFQSSGLLKRDVPVAPSSGGEPPSPADAPPVLQADTGVGGENSVIRIDLLSNDRDPEGSILTIQSVANQPITVGETISLGNGATITLLNNGVIDFNPGNVYNSLAVGESATERFPYTVIDQGGNVVSSSVTVTIQGLNDDPLAADDATSSQEGQPVTLSPLANDHDTDSSDQLTITSVTPASNGTVTLNPDQTVTFQPGTDFAYLHEGETAIETVQYTISDGNGGTDTATLSFTVVGVNQSPDAQNDVASVDEDGSVIIDVLSNDTDPEGSLLTITTATAPSGTVTISPAGELVFTPDPDFSGTETITYQITDGEGGTDTATVVVTVNPINDAPVAEDDVVTTDEEVPATIAVLDNDTDVDGDPLTVTSATAPTGTVTISPTGELVFTPDPNFTGTETITYQVSDGNGATDTATVVVTVNNVNDLPVAYDDANGTDQDTVVTIDLLGGTDSPSGNPDSDIDGDTLQVTSVSGTLTDPNTYTLASGAIVTVNPDGTADYNPNGSFTSLDVSESATDTFTYTISDGNGGTDVATVTVTVNGLEDATATTPDIAVGPEDTPITGNVLTNDSDPDANDNPLSVVGNSNPSHGTVTVNPDGQFTYTPDPNFTGTDTFTYTTQTGATEIVTLTVTSVNDAPVATDDPFTSPEDTVLTLTQTDLTGNDSDVDNDPLTVIAVTSPANGTVSIVSGQVEFTPDPDFTGTASFIYTVSDGNGGTDTATATLTITSVNDAPVAQDDTATTNEDTAVTVAVLSNDSDVDGDPLTVTNPVSPNGTVTVTPSGELIFTPDPDFSGTETITYTLSDGQGGTDTANVVVTVNAVNDAPVAYDDADSTDQNTVVNINLLGAEDSPSGNADSDVDGDLLHLDSIDGIAAGGTFQISSGALVTVLAGGKIDYNPNGVYDYLDAGETAIDTFNYIVSDGNGGSDTATVSVTINGIEDATVTNPDAATGPEDTPISGNVLTNDSDPDSSDNPLTVVGNTNPSHGTVTVNPDGTFTYTPDANYTGTDTFTYTTQTGATETVTVTLTPVNDAPMAVDDTHSVNEETPTTISVLTNDSDADNDPLTVTGVAAPNGTVSINPDGTLSYQGDPNFTGTDTITYTISDGNGETDTAIVVVTVNSVNDAPVAMDDTATVTEDTPQNIDVLSNDGDVDGDPLTVTVATAPNGTVTIKPDGTLDYTPDPDYTGTDTITYTVSDGQGGTDTAIVVVTVTPVNDAPVAVDDADTTNQDGIVNIDLLSAVDSPSGFPDSDVDGDTLQVISVSGTSTGPNTYALASGAIVTVNPDGTADYDPNGSFTSLDVTETAIDTFTYTVSDGNGGTDTATVSVTVNGLEDATVTAPDTASGPEDTPITGNVLTNDSDPDSSDNPLTVVSHSRQAKAASPSTKGIFRDRLSREMCLVSTSKFKRSSTVVVLA